MILELNQIYDLIPHRDPFLFVDKCEIIKSGEHGISYKKFKAMSIF